MSQKGRTQFSEIEAYWYKRLRDEPNQYGETFKDIEDVSDDDRPLLEWHSFSFTSQKAQIRKEKRSPYQHKIDTFANDPSFKEIAVLMVKHGNSIHKPEDIERIWELHRNAFSERGIAAEMNCSRSCITFLLRRIREWMKLV